MQRTSVLNSHRGIDGDAKSLANLLECQGQPIIKDPPRDLLPAVPSEDSAFFMYPTSDTKLYLTSSSETHALRPKPNRRRRPRMAKKRRSLQSLFIPSFLTAPPSPTTDTFTVDYNAGRARSQSMASQPRAEPFISTQQRDSPPPFLLDDDPFANLSAAPAIVHTAPTVTTSTPLETPPPTPRSPLTPDFKPGFLSSPPSSSKPISVPSRTISGRVRPAYSKPAFAPRPSLPSLDILARTNVVITRKASVRKGRVGARLPFEPWDQPEADLSSSSESSVSSHETWIPEESPSAPPDFVSELETDEILDHDDEILTVRTDVTLTSQEPETPSSQEDSLSEISLDSLDDDEYITSSELSYLSRSNSVTSSSSIGSPEFQWPSFGNQSGTTSFSDTPDTSFYDTEYQSRFDSHNIISSYWTSDDLLDSLNEDASTSAVYSDLLNESDMKYEPGTSAGTIRPAPTVQDRPQSQSSFDNDEELVDGSGRENSHRGGGGFIQGTGYTSGGNVSRTNGSGIGGDSRASGSGTRRFGGRGDDEDDEDKRKRINRSTFPTTSDSEEESEDPDEDSADDYGEPFREGTSSDDDVPLAQRIPNALKAQNTIRRQVREEREQRRAARAARAAATASVPRGLPGLPPGAGEPSHMRPMSSSQEAALHASMSMHRAPTRTAPPPEMQPFSPDDLSRRLQNMEMADPSRVARPRTATRDPSIKQRSASRPGSAGHGIRDPTTSPPMATSPDNRTLRPSRSFHRPEGRRPLEEHHAHPLPADASRKLGRSLTRHEEGSSTSPRSYPARLQDENAPRPAPSRRSGDESRRLVKHSDARSTRSSSEIERPPRRPSPTRPPVPPLPAEALANSSSPPNLRGPVTQQRVFIGDMQRFNMVEIGTSTTAGDVIEMVEAQGSLKGWVGSGGWMVWEIAQDFGMERPIRSFELLSDVQASWNKDKLMNTFVIRLTPLALPLSRSAMPSASPTHAGYVEWESKRGKWNKRWLHLREHSLWLSKRDNGRDEVLLCSLSNFDAYFITRLHKAPREFSFALKSTDNLSFFENTADYLHIFSCSEKEGRAWVERILLARSYVLYQERNVLFNPKAPNANAAGNSSALSRAGTRKMSSAHRPVAQPLISGIAAPMTIAQQLQSNDVFEPGSLLRKHN
ncbi:hypothetical protein H0H92_009632 [Tricholoma furcatifolium]|nr:hypothetical protein H0H92_009632 [Tricholoma furcatifolium]